MITYFKDSMDCMSILERCHPVRILWETKEKTDLNPKDLSMFPPNITENQLHLQPPRPH